MDHTARVRHLKKSFLTSATIIKFSVLQDILKKAEKYQLGLDIRTAAYVKSLENLFRILYDSKLYTSSK